MLQVKIPVGAQVFLVFIQVLTIIFQRNPCCKLRLIN